MNLELAIREYLKDIEIRKFTPKTIRSYSTNLRILFLFAQQEGFTDTEDLSMGLIKAFTAFQVNRGRKGTYINGLLKVAKSFITYCYNEGYGGFNTRHRFQWVKEEKPVILAFKPEHVHMLLADCKGNDFMSLRDRCILTCFFETGIRNWELCCIKREDVHEDFIIINGKHHKQRVVPITPVLSKAMMRYERVRDNRYPYPKTDYYFVSYHDNQLTNEGVEHIFKQHGEGIEGVRVSPHTARHTFAQMQVKMGTDLYTISRLLGHENIGITQTYLDSLRDEDVIQVTKQRSVLMNLQEKYL